MSIESMMPFNHMLSSVAPFSSCPQSSPASKSFPMNFRLLLNKTLSLLKKKIIYFNWRIIALQYCADFCQTSTWINHRYTHVPSRPTHTPSHLSRFSQSSKFELPASDSMVISAFPCYSLHSSYPFLPALCPEICSLCLCLHCCITSWEILFLM